MFDVLFLAGPTAAGKTEYAIRLARDLNGEIVSADSMQLYKYMDIGSAKPTADERALAKHYLVDEIDPREPFSAAKYKILAQKYIDLIASAGRLPIVCGGTGLYFSTLIYDMDFSAPSGNDEKRKMILEEENSDPEKLYLRLKRLDPAAADEIHPNNVKRVLRAIERLEGGEKQLASFSSVSKVTDRFRPILIAVTRDREELYSRIDARVDRLYKMGLADEVRKLSELGFTSSDVAMKGIGYKEIMDAVTSGGNAEDASETIKLNTRHYAKRQLTWFRRYENMRWFTLNGSEFDENTYGQMLSYVKEQLK